MFPGFLAPWTVRGLIARRSPAFGVSRSLPVPAETLDSEDSFDGGADAADSDVVRSRSHRSGTKNDMDKPGKNVEDAVTTVMSIYLNNSNSYNQWRRNEFENGGGGTVPAQIAGKFCGLAPSLLALKVQFIVVLVSAFVMVSTVLSVSCLLFFYSRCPPCPAICKSGGTFPP